jgi:uncharacterized membrane protein YfcA
MLGAGWTEGAALAAAFVIAVLATPAGISGAVLLLPFQVSVLGTPSPAVTPTNLADRACPTRSGTPARARRSRARVDPARGGRWLRRRHLAGVFTFLVLSVHHHGSVAPDWPTGIALGVGGLAGAYTGARIQRHLPDMLIRRVMGVLVVAIGARYLWSGLG